LAAAFGEVIAEERVSLGVAQDAFALKAGIDRSNYGRLERGERQPSLGLAFRIAASLGISPAVLVSRVEDALQRREHANTAAVEP
jgi:transcriptional regulator with XRE-family HTH domain